MEAEQSKMLAGKFRDAEQLESAYLELQKKLGSSTDSEDDTEIIDDQSLLEDNLRFGVGIIWKQTLWPFNGKSHH